MIAASINWLNVQHGLNVKTLLRALLFSLLILTTTLGGRYYYHHPNYTDEEIEAKKRRNLPKVTQLVNGRAWIQTWFQSLPFPYFNTIMIYSFFPYVYVVIFSDV